MMLVYQRLKGHASLEEPFWLVIELNGRSLMERLVTVGDVQ